MVLIPLNMLFAQSQSTDDRWLVFLEKYADGYNPDWYGKEMPAFHFDERLNSENLKGKPVLLDYWATWCSACRIYAKEFDEIAGKDFYKNNLQIIGVNIEGADTRKIGNNSPRKYWEAKGHKYPMVEGASADASGAAIKNGFPTIILLDKKGFIRGRWDTYTPQVKDVIKLGVWVLSDTIQKYTAEQVATEIRLRNYYKALFISDQLPKDEVFESFRLRAMLKVSEWDATIYAKKLYENAKNTMSGEAYEDFLYNLCSEIVESQALLTDANKLGLEIANELENRSADYSKDYIFLDSKAKLYWRTSQRDKAKEYAEKALQTCIDQKVSPVTIDYFKALIDTYSKPPQEEVTDMNNY